MPHHKQVTTCRKTGGPTSNYCSCEHCTLAVCSVCGAWEAALTTDCPGVAVSADRRQEVCETNLDYTDDRGWHQRGWHQSAPDVPRSPRFEDTKVPPAPPQVDPRTLIAPTIDWAAVDRNAELGRTLERKAIAWVLADRICEDHSATLTRIEDEVDAIMLADKKPSKELFAQHEQVKIAFHLADQRAQLCKDEFEQAARLLVDGLEAAALIRMRP
jgi:hypothetical protein